MAVTISKLSNFLEHANETQKLPILVLPTYHAATGRHSHDFFELVYIREGFCLHDAEDKMSLLMEGDLFLLKPSQTHRYVGNRVVSIYNCLFAPEMIPEALAVTDAFSLGPIYPHIHLTLSERKNVLRLLDGMHQERAEKSPFWAIKMQGMLDCLLVDYARMLETRAGTDARKQAHTGYVMPALEYIEREYASDLTVKAIANVAGVSADYLTRQFKLVLGIAPLDYLRRYRFARAMELLQKNIRIVEVSEKVGFRSLAHFSREFKKELGLTPSQYRAQNEAQNE